MLLNYHQCTESFNFPGQNYANKTKRCFFQSQSHLQSPPSGDNPDQELRNVHTRYTSALTHLDQLNYIKHIFLSMVYINLAFLKKTLQTVHVYENCLKCN